MKCCFNKTFCDFGAHADDNWNIQTIFVFKLMTMGVEGVREGTAWAAPHMDDAVEDKYVHSLHS